MSDHICNQLYKSKLQKTNPVCCSEEFMSDKYSDAILKKYNTVFFSSISGFNEMSCLFSSKLLLMESFVTHCNSEGLIINFSTSHNWTSVQTCKNFNLSDILSNDKDGPLLDLSSCSSRLPTLLNSFEQEKKVVSLAIIEVGSLLFRTREDLIQIVELLASSLGAEILLDYSRMNYLKEMWITPDLLTDLKHIRERIHFIVDTKQVLSTCSEVPCVILTCGSQLLLNTARKWTALAPLPMSSQREILTLLEESEWLTGTYLPFLQSIVSSNLKSISSQLTSFSIDFVVDESHPCVWCNFHQHFARHSEVSQQNSLQKLDDLSSVSIGASQLFGAQWTRVTALVDHDTLIQDLECVRKILSGGSDQVCAAACYFDENEFVIEEVKEENLEDLFSKFVLGLRKDPTWLHEHTAEKWIDENPVTAQLFLAEREKCLKELNQSN